MHTLQPAFEVIDESSVRRRLTVKPGMCGYNSLFVGQIGDWTWETVTALCGTDVFNARNECGLPTYLAFYYFHVRASTSLHLHSFSFGDQISVSSRLFNFGSESILALHQIEREGTDGSAPRPVDPTEFYECPRDDRLYVENFNRWITRSEQQSNRGLMRSSPAGFRHSHLPVLPEMYSPRRAYQSARLRGQLHDPGKPGYRLLAEDFRVDYPLDITRDINGVGLVYFAAYFSMIDWAFLRLWRHLGRSDRSFLQRIVTDQRVCYLGNADLDSVMCIRMNAWQHITDPSLEVVGVVIEDRDTHQTIAVSALDVKVGCSR